jgi:hypothetical protein
MDKLTNRGWDVVEESQSAKEKKWKQVTGGMDLRGNTARYRIRLPQLKGAKEEQDEREGETPIKATVDQGRGG